MYPSSFAEASLHFFIACLLSGGTSRGAEPRIELGPALQQADALPTEPRRTGQRRVIHLSQLIPHGLTPPCLPYPCLFYLRQRRVIHLSQLIPHRLTPRCLPFLFHVLFMTEESHRSLLETNK
jgi:hypothetical protein